MATDGHENQHEIYPRRYFDEAPSWFAWNSLTANDLQLLREEPGFNGQRIYFYLNHPIRFVSLVGVASQIELGGGAAAQKYCFICLDDGSGVLANVKIQLRQADGMTYPSNTMVDNVNISTGLGLASVFVDGKTLQVGQVVRIRGTLEKWRDRMQIELKRIKMVKSTAEEVEHWKAIAEWKKVLEQPWVLTLEQRQEFDAKAVVENEETQERQKRRKIRHEKQARKNAKLEVKYNDGALPGSEIVKAPWEG